MPVNCPFWPRPISQEEFTRLDYQITRLAFASQNGLGRLCDETIYENDLAARIEASGLGPVRKQLPLTVTHRDFIKVYFLDLVVQDAAIYELKTVIKLISEHAAQLLNYLFLWGGQHGKLVNFRPPQVESRFVNTQLTPQARKRIEIDSRRWSENDQASEVLRSTFLNLLQDWGAFLDLELYTEALVHFLGGAEQVTRMVPLCRDGIPLGNQRMLLISPRAAFRLTAMENGHPHYERQLQSMLNHSPLQSLHWINLYHHQVEFITLKKQP